MSFHDGTERELLTAVRSRLRDADAPVEDRPALVIDAVDRFCWNHHWMMLVGDEKGAILDEALRRRAAVADEAPFVALELGTYVGYSALRLARLLPPGGRLVSCDPDRGAQGAARELLDLAGLADFVELVQLPAQACIQLLGARGEPLDFVFIDHEKQDYLPSLRRLEAARLLKPGAVVVADNVDVFRIEDYLRHVRSSGLYRSQHSVTALEYTQRAADGTAEIMDGVEVSTFLGHRPTDRTEF